MQCPVTATARRVAVVGALALASLAFASDPVADLKTSVARGQQIGPAVRQGIAGLGAVPAAWDRTAERFTRFVADLQGAGGAVDPNALVQEVLRQSYVQTTEDLRFYAEKVKYFNEQKKALRDYLGQLRNADARLRTAGRAVPELRSAGLEQAVNRLGAQDRGLEGIRESLSRRAARLQALSPRDANITKTLVAVLQESIKDMNEQKKYLLARLDEMNKAAEDLGEQQKRLADASARLADEEKKDSDKKNVRSR